MEMSMNNNISTNCRMDKAIDGIFFLGILLLPFTSIPMRFPFPFSGVLAFDKTWSVFCFIALAVVLFIACILKYRKLHGVRVFLIFFFFSFTSILLTSIMSVKQFSFFSIETWKLSSANIVRASRKLKELFPILSEKQAWDIWAFLQIFITQIIQWIYSYGVVFVIFNCFFGRWRHCLAITTKALTGMAYFVITYAGIELLYLYGSSVAERLLLYVNPLLHSIEENGYWWPPKLWPSGMRSIFPEPSWMGSWISFTLPFLWLDGLKKRRILSFILSIFFFLIVFLSNARTCFFLVAGELIVFLIIGWCAKKQNIIRFAVILSCVFVLIYFCAGFLQENTVFATETKTVSAASVYYENVIGNITNVSSRSNSARFGVILSELKVGLQHFFWGVSPNFRSAYCSQQLPDFALQNPEIQTWIGFLHDSEFYGGAFPILNEYSYTFASFGFWGLVIELCPLLFIGIKLVIMSCSKKRQGRLWLKEDISVITVVFCGCVAFGLSSGFTTNYHYWIVLALGLLLIQQDKDALLETDRVNND